MKENCNVLMCVCKHVCPCMCVFLKSGKDQLMRTIICDLEDFMKVTATELRLLQTELLMLC